ncbi:MAG: hypothetical protein HOQ05_04850 [Corynebacteriales bacterium]|nr:hypothetical protein [Mycobacteriales bacterium]
MSGSDRTRSELGDPALQALLWLAEDQIIGHIDNLLAPLDMQVGSFSYERADLNHHHKRSSERVRCAKVNSNRRKPVVEIDPDGLRRCNALRHGRESLFDTAAEVLGHELAHIATNKNRRVAMFRRKLGSASYAATQEVEKYGPNDSAMLTADGHRLLWQALRLRDAVETQSYLREGLGRYSQANVMRILTRQGLTDRKSYLLRASALPKYGDGGLVVGTMMDHPHLGPRTLLGLLQGDGPLNNMITKFEAEYDIDRWSKRVRNVALPDLDFVARFGAKYDADPGGSVERLLQVHAPIGSMFTLALADIEGRMPRALVDLVWDIGHLQAAHDHKTNPHEMLARTNHDFMASSDERRIGSISALLNKATEAAVDLTENSDGMPATVANLAVTVSELMRAEISTSRYQRGVTTLRSLLQR